MTMSICNQQGGNLEIQITQAATPNSSNKIFITNNSKCKVQFNLSSSNK
jgi:hypothetical protein